MRVRIQQINSIVGDIEGNSRLISEAIGKAEADGIRLLILPELVLGGYPLMDLVERESFRDCIYQATTEIVKKTGDLLVIFGTLTDNSSNFGRKCYNSAVAAHNGKEIGRVHKTLLPTYDVFDDLRYFEPNKHFECLEFEGVNLGITICEDIWYNENDIQYHTYEVNPARVLAEQGADVIINISASPYTKTKPINRQEMLQDHAESLKLPVFYANQVGANTELIFDGDSMAVGDDTLIYSRAPLFEEASIDLEWNPKKRKIKNTGEPVAELPEPVAGMFKGLAFGLKDYLRKTRVTDEVVVGLSGGIDSALATCIAVEALGSENVTAISLPSDFSSEGSISDAEKLADNLGIILHKLSIHEIFDKFRLTLNKVFGNTEFSVTEENIQTRIRGVLLMAYSNKTGCMMLNTGNKSELATGYCTLYGDMAGGLGVINDLYKTEVYEMARWLNETYYNKEVIPQSVIDKEPSAELRPGQKDTDKLPPYDVLDQILMRYIENQKSFEEIVEDGFDRKVVNNVIFLVDNSEFKRYQAVPGLKVSTKAFGTGRRRPIAQRWTENQIKNR